MQFLTLLAGRLAPIAVFLGPLDKEEPGADGLEIASTLGPTPDSVLVAEFLF